MSKWIAILLIGGIVISFLREWFFKILIIILVGIIVWYAVRWLADFYWWGKDNDKF